MEQYVLYIKGKDLWSRIIYSRNGVEMSAQYEDILENQGIWNDIINVNAKEITVNQWTASQSIIVRN